MNTIKKDKGIETLAVISKQLEKILNYNSNIPLIEIDIIKENIRKLYEFVDGINQNSKIVDESNNISESLDAETNELLSFADDEFKAELQEIYSLNKEEIKINEPQDSNLSEIKKTETLETSEVEKADFEPINKTEKDQIKVHFLDVLAEEEELDNKSESSNVKPKSIESLKNGIGINDKFMIINDLFEGNAKAFNAAIQVLDNQENLQQAIFIFQDLKDENLWESTDFAYKQFKDYLERRYR